MKQVIYFIFSFFFFSTAFSQNVGINTDGSPANNSSMLDVKSTSKGMLVPRMTTAQRNAIVSPANGLLVYDTDVNSFWFYNGTNWTNVAGGGGNGTGWTLTGNTGTNPSTNFIGTTDNQPVLFKVNNQAFGKMDTNGSIFWGKNAGSANTGFSNIAIGTGALFSNTQRSNLVAIGDSALYNNGSDISNGGFGQGNIAIGSKSMFSNITGGRNTAIGYQSLMNSMESFNNTAVGHKSLFSNATGSYNTAMGVSTLQANITGSNNTAIGYESMYFTTTGNFNTALGYNTLFDNTTGTNNVAVGSSSLAQNTSGNNNCGLGVATLVDNTTGYENTGIGSLCLNRNTTGYGNTSSGYRAMATNIFGSRNTSFGTNTMLSNTSGHLNTVIGYQAMNVNTTGDQNVSVGSFALTNNTTGSNNTVIGYNAEVTSGNLQNATAIGSNAAVNASNKVTIGNSSVTSIGGYANWSNFSDGRFKRNVKEDVPGLTFITKLRPVTYTLDVDGINDFNSKNLPADKKQQTINPEKKNEVYTGFLAQEVEQAAKDLGFNFSGIDRPKDASTQSYALRYSDFVVPMVKAMQELKEQIDDLKKQNAELKTLLTHSK